MQRAREMQEAGKPCGGVSGRVWGSGGGGAYVDEVEGAVDGVDDKGGRVGDARGAGDEGFFADEGVGGVEGGEAGGDEGFDGAVGGGYEVRGWGGLVMSEG